MKQFLHLGVNVFGLWKHNFWRNILHTESVVLEKVPEFSAESLCLRQGMVTWCHMIQKGHVTPTATSYSSIDKANFV